MPLHAIFVINGHAGLQLETAPFTDADSARIREGAALAARHHAGDRR